MILPEDVLQHAKYLYAHEKKTELLMRNVVRSAYYALYHKLLNLDLPELDDKEKECGSHVQLIKKLNKSMVDGYSILGSTLAELKFIRVKADYHLGTSLTNGEAYKSLRKVEKVFENMNNIKTKEAKTEGNIEVVMPVEPSKKRQPFKVVK